VVNQAFFSAPASLRARLYKKRSGCPEDRR
jgi:hypothetical protein